MSQSQITGLSIMKDELQFAAMRRTKGAPRLIDSRTAAFSAADDGAEADTDTQSAAVAELKALKSSLRGDVSIGLTSDQALVRIIELPATDPAELDSMVDLQIDRLSPFPSESTVTSYEVLSSTETASRVLVAITQRSAVAAVGDLLQASGITAHRLDLNVLGLWRLIVNEDAVPSVGHHVALIMGSTVDVIVAANGTPIMLRSLGVPGELDADDIVSEIDYTLTTLEAEHGINRISSASIWHRDAFDESLLPDITDRLGVEPGVRRIESLPSIAEGLAHRAADTGRKRINLAPEEWLLSKKRIAARRKLAVASVLLLLAWSGAVGTLFAGLHMQQQNIQQMTDELVSLKAPSRKARELRSMLIRTEQYTDRTHSALECLREVTLVKPNEIEFRTFKYAGEKEGTVTVQGESSTPNAVLDFENSLDKSKLFKSASLIGPKSIKGKHTFTITLKLTKDQL